MKSNENEIPTHLNGSFAVPFTMTIKAIVISNQDCFDGEWNALVFFGCLTRATICHVCRRAQCGKAGVWSLENHIFQVLPFANSCKA